MFASAIISIDLNDWTDKLNGYDHSCFDTEMDRVNRNTTNTFYTSPIYDLVHPYLSFSTTNSMKVFFAFAYIVLYSNVIEGIIYIRSAAFVFR